MFAVVFLSKLECHMFKSSCHKFQIFVLRFKKKQSDMFFFILGSISTNNGSNNSVEFFVTLYCSVPFCTVIKITKNRQSYILLILAYFNLGTIT